ncbi:histidine kinase N-terminal 7TM domain-containing protein [Acidimangrovimonas pyrenivorans]|uniref:histidine kinase n=1 Tax=Acidimangrovimonas pyrenivorans TaxID=2030798 RepID=A0ABV7AE74_9RHOB
MPCLTSLTLDFPVLAVSVLLIGLTAMRIWVWRGRRFPGKQAFSAAYYAMLWWLFTAGMELASTDLDCKLFWARAAWPGIVLLPTAWALFFYDYAIGDEQGADSARGRRRRLALLLTGPVLIGLMAFTDGWHHLFYGAATRMVMVDGRMSGAYVHGPLFYVAVVYDYLFMLASILIGLSAIWRSSPAFRGFFVVLLGMTAGPVVGNLAYVLGGFTLFGFDPTPFLFSIVLGAFGWLVLNNRMMDISGIARDILFYDSRDPILITDPDERLVGYNPEAQRVFGGDLPEIGTPLAEMAQLGPILARLRNPDRSHSVAPILRDDRAFDPRLLPIINPLAPTRASLGWLLKLVDISEQQRAATSLRLAADRAREASQAKTQFVSTVSHELRTPLTSIKGALSLLNSPIFAELKPEARRILQIAASNSDRLHALIDDLLDLNRIEAGAMTFQRAPVDLVQLVKEAAEANEGYGTSFSVSLRLSLVEGPLYVGGDHGRLLQVLANVLSNAFKFSKAGDTVTVTLERRNGMARVSVHDEGIGIPEGSHDKVFGAFTQLDASDTRKVNGSGLGMSITRRIVEMHEGHIDYTSTPGEGTTFFIELPLLKEGDQPAAAPLAS